MNRPDTEHFAVTVNAYIHHRHNHTIASPDPECVFCDDVLVDADRIEDGVIYLNGEDER